jgi:hypothetical protein
MQHRFLTCEIIIAVNVCLFENLPKFVELGSEERPREVNSVHRYMHVSFERPEGPLSENQR